MSFNEYSYKGHTISITVGKTVRGEYIGIPKVNKSIVDDRLGLGHKTESKAEDAAKIIAENYINDK